MFHWPILVDGLLLDVFIEKLLECRTGIVLLTKTLVALMLPLPDLWLPRLECPCRSLVGARLSGGNRRTVRCGSPDCPAA